MQFNDVSSSSGLVQDADFWAGTDVNKYTLVHKARNANEWVKKVGAWIWQSSSTWKFDDSNLTTLPVATNDLVANQQDYTLPTSIFKLDRVEVMDADGNYQKLIPFDKSQVTDEAMDEFLSVAGMPRYYDVEGNSLFLYPKPASASVTLTNGIQIYVGRDIDPFISTDTIKEPGFSEYFHRVVSIGMALDYAVSKGLKDKATALRKVLYGDPSVSGDKGLKGDIQEAYGTRDRDFKTKLRVKVDNRI